MSYCRWSSDNWKSDVYVYGDVSGGITCHVAGNRIVGDIPEVPAIGSVSEEEWRKAMQASREYMDKAAHVAIGLSLDGKSFNEPDEAAMAARLLQLRAEGYSVPQHAIDALLEEAAEANGPTVYEQQK